MSEDWQASSKKESKAVFVRLCAIFFMLGMGPGFWLPGLTNIIKQAGWGNDWVALVFFIFPIASMISPLCSGAIADQKIAAQKLAAWVSVISTITMVGAFYCLDRGLHPWYFVGFFFLTTVIGAPLWNLVITIAMTHLPRPEAQFAQVRLWCTVGWILGGWIASLVMRADASPMAGYAGAVCRVILACSLLFAPHTPPRGASSHWRSLLGFDAFRLLKDKNLRVLLIGSAVLTMPITSFYMHTPEHLRALGDMRSTFTMSFGQWSEVAAMAVTGWLMLRYRLKTLLLVGLGFSVLRFVLFSLGGEQESLLWMWPGIAIHGICYTLFFITGQIYMDQRVEPAMRGQMQGLLGLVTNGIGALLGTVGLKILHRYTVESRGDWTSYWAVLTGFTVICTLWFIRAFDEKKTPAAE